MKHTPYDELKMICAGGDNSNCQLNFYNPPKYQIGCGCGLVGRSVVSFDNKVLSFSYNFIIKKLTNQLGFYLDHPS